MPYHFVNGSNTTDAKSEIYTAAAKTDATMLVVDFIYMPYFQTKNVQGLQNTHFNYNIAMPCSYIAS